MIYLFRIYQWLIAAPILLAATILTALSTSVGSILGGGNWWGYYPPMLWSKLFCWLMFVRVSVEGRDNIDSKTSYVFISNHQGAYDIFTIYGYLNHNFKWMMKKSLEKIPFVGFACKRCGHIFVDRSCPSAIKNTMNIAKKTLRNGMSLVVFPEGARTWNGKMRAFKRGAFKLAVDFDLPIVPLTINGSFNILPRTTYNITPGKIRLIIHKPVIGSGEKPDMDAIMEESYSKIQSGLDSKYRN